jgi:hypothetical protein
VGAAMTPIYGVTLSSNPPHPVALTQSR